MSQSVGTAMTPFIVIKTPDMTLSVELHGEPITLDRKRQSLLFASKLIAMALEDLTAEGVPTDVQVRL